MRLVANRGLGWLAALGLLAAATLLPRPAAAAEILGPGDRAALILSHAIQIPTVNPPGGEAPLAQYLVEQLRAAGIEAGVIAVPEADEDGDARDETGNAPAAAREAGAGRAMAWGRLRGRGARRPVVLLSHLDVVPAEADSWEHPPFAGVIKDGAVHGRGALDAKGVAVIHLVTLLGLAGRTTPLDRDVILLATPDEESGGLLGAHRLVERHPELLADAEYLLTEGGGIRPTGDGRPTTWGVTVSEKSPCWLEVEARGTPGHSSAPKPDAAVPRLVSALERIHRLETPIRVVPGVAHMFERMAPDRPGDERANYEDLARALEEDTAFRRHFLRNPGFNALVRNTVSITVLEGSQRTNVTPSRARAQLDARLLPGESCEAFKSTIEEVIADDDVEVTIRLAFPSRASPSNTALFHAIESVAERRDPGARVIAQVIAGFTDAHWFRELGIVSYGFVPRRLAPEETRGIHGPNERISIENLAYGVEVLTEILEELSER